MLMKTIYLYLTVILFACYACSDLAPDADVTIDDQDFWKDRDFSMAVLNEAYHQLPAFYTDELGSFLDCATDNAVTNDFSSPLIAMATGGWNAANNPINSWKNCYIQIRNLNEFIEEEPGISYSNDNQKNKDIHKRVKGEAFFLRAWYQFELLSRFAGLDSKGNLLGYPIVLKPLNDEEIRNIPRNSFDECVDRINRDIDTALVYLPAVQYAGTDVVTGVNQTGRAYRLPALSLKSRLLLYAASPAYTTKKSAQEKQTLWENAAKASMAAITVAGSLPAISTNGDIYTTPGHAEIIWRSYQPDNNQPETENFLPSLWGNGRTNPSQQLVDAFPMKDGYPAELSPTYNAQTPYAGRDNRFGLAIVYNDMTFGTSKAEIYTGGTDYESSGTERATRTGYYLRKFMDPKVNLTPGTETSVAKHYYAFFRKGELWLNYAEAANMAWGPDSDPLGLGKTAKKALSELRVRSGINATDPYLDEVAGSKEAMNTLVQNERRIELCFENHRFFDVRRWLLPAGQLNETIGGVKITKNNNTFSYQYGQQVESRKFESYMYYGPLPEQEVYASEGTIVQNAGW